MRVDPDEAEPGGTLTQRKAPWTAAQVRSLVKWQTGDFGYPVHPFTCARDHEWRNLVPTVDGWTCPQCDYTQDWAHDFMMLTCDVCNGESGGTFVGVASVPGAPVSIAWCEVCLRRQNVVPSWILEHDWDYVAARDLSQLAEWAVERETWVDGRYVSFRDFVDYYLWCVPEMAPPEPCGCDDDAR